MLPTMILVDGRRVRDRPNDKKDLDRLSGTQKISSCGNEEAKVTHGPADEVDPLSGRGFHLHKAWGGADDTYIGLRFS